MYRPRSVFHSAFVLDQDTLLYFSLIHVLSNPCLGALQIVNMSHFTYPFLFHTFLDCFRFSLLRKDAMNKPSTGVTFCPVYTPELELQCINILVFTGYWKIPYTHLHSHLQCISAHVFKSLPTYKVFILIISLLCRHFLI